MLLDLSKAYDCLDRNILLNKLELYGIRGNAKEWLSSYLNDRKQLVKLTKSGVEVRSRILSTTIGIAQGSVLGPLLFIIFVNDLSFLVRTKKEHIVKYADDTNILLSGQNLQVLTENAQRFFDVVSCWFQSNKLILNKDKTKALLFRTRQSSVKTPESLSFAEVEVTFSTESKLLGVCINEVLDWSCHINALAKKLNSICYGIRVVGGYMNERALRIMYFSNFESVMRYGIIFWGSSGVVYNVFVVQKRLIRIINGMKYLESCRTVFKSLGIMTVYGLYIFECLLFFFKHRSMFDSTPSHSNRNAHVIYPRHRLALTEKYPNYMCLKLFNCLPECMKKIESEKIFKQQIKKHLIELEPYSLKEFHTDL